MVVGGRKKALPNRATWLWGVTQDDSGYRNIPYQDPSGGYPGDGRG